MRKSGGLVDEPVVDQVDHANAVNLRESEDEVGEEQTLCSPFLSVNSLLGPGTPSTPGKMYFWFPPTLPRHHS